MNNLSHLSTPRNRVKEADTNAPIRSRREQQLLGAVLTNNDVYGPAWPRHHRGRSISMIPCSPAIYEVVRGARNRQESTSPRPSRSRLFSRATPVWIETWAGRRLSGRGCRFGRVVPMAVGATNAQR